jgi:hypothetical protein
MNAEPFLPFTACRGHAERREVAAAGIHLLEVGPTDKILLADAQRSWNDRVRHRPGREATRTNNVIWN